MKSGNLLKISLWAVCCLLLVSFTGCCHDGKDPDADTAGALTLTLKSVAVDLSVLGNFDIEVDDTIATTLMSEVSPVSNIAMVEMADADKGQMLFVEDVDGNLLAVIYIDAAGVKNGTFMATIASIANGLLMTNPIMMATTDEDRLALLEKCQSSATYGELLDAITNALTTEHQNALNADVFPELYVLSLQMIIEAMDEGKATVAGQINRADITLGDTNSAPFVTDLSGGAVRINNPRYVFYGIDITGQEPQVIKGRSGWLDIGLFPPHAQISDPITEDINIGDGSFIFDFSKGGLTDAGLMAAGANFLKTGVLIIDTLFWCPLSDDAIENLAELNYFEYLSQAGIDILQDSFSVNNLVSSTVELLLDKDVWVEITKTVYKNAPDKEQAVKLLSNTKTLLKGANVAFKILGAYKAANTIIPFAKDLIVAPLDVELCGTQTGGVLTETCQQIPPTAVADKTSPNEVYVGGEVVFDASGSRDDVTGSDDLEFAWDFDGDGTLDTGWMASKTATWAYSNVGSFDVVLYARDIDGLIGKDIYGLVVEARTALGTANHIKAFRNRRPWDTTSFEDTMAANGYTEGGGEKQYEILTSSALATEIMVPGEDLVVIMNDQDQTFYNDLAASMDRLERFLANGGVVIWGACDLGWGDGSMVTAGITSLPAAVLFSADFDNYNYNNNPDSELMDGVPSPLYGSYASHESFSNLPAGTTIHMVDSSGDPTLVEFEYDRGWVMLTGQPLEFHVVYNTDQMGRIYPRLFNYVLGTVTKSKNVARGVSLLKTPPPSATSAR